MMFTVFLASASQALFTALILSTSEDVPLKLIFWNYVDKLIKIDVLMQIL